MDGRIHIQDRQVLDTLERLRGLSHGRARPVMEDIARYGKTSTQLRFRRQAGPDGQRWWPSVRAREQGGQTLRDTNRLFRSITWRAGPNYAAWGTNVVYAAAHNFGIRRVVQVKAHRRMTTRRWEGGISVKSVQVKAHPRLQFTPKREYLGFSRADMREILVILVEGIEVLARK